MKPLPEGWIAHTAKPWSEKRPLCIGPDHMRKVWQPSEGGYWVATDRDGCVIGGPRSPRKFEGRAGAILAAEGKA